MQAYKKTVEGGHPPRCEADRMDRLRGLLMGMRSAAVACAAAGCAPLGAHARHLLPRGVSVDAQDHGPVRRAVAPESALHHVCRRSGETESDGGSVAAAVGAPGPSAIIARRDVAGTSTARAPNTAAMSAGSGNNCWSAAASRYPETAAVVHDGSRARARHGHGPLHDERLIEELADVAGHIPRIFVGFSVRRRENMAEVDGTLDFETASFPCDAAVVAAVRVPREAIPADRDFHLDRRRIQHRGCRRWRSNDYRPGRRERFRAPPFQCTLVCFLNFPEGLIDLLVNFG